MENYKIIFLSCLLALFFLNSINMVCATSTTINSTNNTLKNVVNNYDTIYLDDGIYNGSGNNNITVSKNTTIIGLHKGSAVINPNYGILFTVNNSSLTLINLTIKNGYGESLIDNFGFLTINNMNFENNSYGYAIFTTGILNITDSTFKNGYIAIRSMYSSDVTIKNTNFINNTVGGLWGLIHVSGGHKTLDFDNLTFVNNVAYDSLISIMASNISLKLSNSRFVNNTLGSLDFIYISGAYGPPSVPNKKELRNIIELGTKVNINPYIDLSIYLKKNKSIVFKATLKKFGEVIPNKRLYFYVNGKRVGSALTDKNGVATFNFKRSSLNFNVQVVFNKCTEKTSTRTINYNGTSFKGSASELVVGNPKIVFKLKSTKKKGGLIYKKYYIYNKGDSFGNKTFNKKISSKYKLVRYISKKVTFKYMLSNKSFSVKVKNQLPYKFNKKSLGVLTLVLRKK